MKGLWGSKFFFILSAVSFGPVQNPPLPINVGSPWSIYLLCFVFSLHSVFFPASEFDSGIFVE